MRLKKIKLAGFKSFVDPTSIPFPDDMTAIVGPNGCGKSNVIDAVRWVLGESSAKNLRGDAMIDVIFNGSSARKPVSQCSVELVFDNSSGRIQGEYANYNELSVKRLVTREAQSFYYLNATKCRRRDVTDLFLGTGLGPRSYAIIEQGMISRLIESKPQELRVFIEEAAGISKYKERRRETENRIRHTKENLERLEDVRGELGQQLEKLQRQASAARRFKELKAKERKYKGELAALRWLKHSNHIESLETQIKQQETDIEAFVAQQRGDEKGITTYKERQQDLKQKLTDIQQQIFSVGTEITRLEQTQIHAKQRRQQIEQELSGLVEGVTDAEIHLQQEEDKKDSILQQISVAEPEQAVLQEQIEQALIDLQDAEENLARHESQWRSEEQEFVQTKQQAQSRHSQIQATMNMQMRTQQRISELQQEQSELEHDALAQQMQSLNSEVAQAQGRYQHAKQSHENMTDSLAQWQQQERQLHEQLIAAQGEVQQVKAKITGVESVLALNNSQQELVEYLNDNKIEHQPLWQIFEIESGWEVAVQTACSFWQAAKVVDSKRVPDDIANIHGAQLLFLDKMTGDKVTGSLASKVTSLAVPAWMNLIHVIDESSEAQSRLDSLANDQSVITPLGEWFGHDWAIYGGDENEKGVLEHAASLRKLNEEHNALVADLQQSEDALQEAKQKLAEAQMSWQRSEEDYRHAEQAFTQQQNQLNLLEMQHQQSLNRQTKLSEELSRQQQQLEEEKIQSEELAMQLEELELSLVDMEERQIGRTEEKESLVTTLEQRRTQVEQLKNNNHQIELQLQTIRSQFSSLQDSITRSKQQLQSMQARKSQLTEEQQQLSMPMEEQAEQLEVLLEKRVITQQQQVEIQNQLAEVDSVLSDAEKGQQGIMDKIQKMRSEMESTKLECEGYRVRANGVLEQLQEMQQSLKPLLESLSEDANEALWQQELEKTTASVARLGAVNLAAVEEFEIQAERKKHLDDQNDDLTEALETLENAIRKIDKETRSRFKETFEKVNNDLKSLFPKVFGGGSAYLELTDDDLLETGVAIMARPPGKKNSTIHLLSGGEKALTALSLVFAIFRLNPAPFCLLDEVDAPLDDANVGRFCKLVSEMSKSVQFIYITHNKIAMEMAKHLTGVTMAEPGVSRMVAVDVEEAVAIAQA